MHKNLMRDNAKTVHEFSNPVKVTSLRIWHCKYKTLVPLSDLKNLRALWIATFPDDTLDILSGLKHLEWLRIIHLPKVTDISPLASLKKLKVLALETLPSWDASGKITTVKSLAPLASIPTLQHLQLFGVVPAKKKLDDVKTCTTLKTARFSKFPKPVVREFYETTGLSDDSIPNYKSMK